MTTDRNVSRMLDLWLSEGIDQVNDRVLDEVESRIQRQRQRPGWRLSWRTTTMSPTKLAATVAAVAVVAVVGFNLLVRQPAVGNPSGPPSTASPTVTPAPTPSATASNPVVGRWTSAASTCEEQNAALQRAGFTAAELELGGWDAATCMQMTHGRTHVIQFLETHVQPVPSGTTANGSLIQYADGGVGWAGYYILVDADTFTAGDGGHPPYLTYQFTITGDRLVIDMVDNKFPATTQAELLGDSIAQTVIYESLPFTRVN